LKRLAATAALACALLCPASASAAEAASGWQRAGFSVYFQYSSEFGSSFDARDVQIGLVYDHRWFELRWTPFAYTGFRDTPADVLKGEFGGWRGRIGFAAPTRLAPFIEWGTDILDGGEAHGTNSDDPTDSDVTVGLRWKVDSHWTVRLYRREYDFHDVDREPPLPQLERLEASTTGIGLSWQF
jgi:opacity protein-like surface antigen